MEFAADQKFLKGEDKSARDDSDDEDRIFECGADGMC
jgi:hypothetical protein